MALLVNEDVSIQTGGSARSHDVVVWKVSSVEGFYCSSIKYKIFEKNSVSGPRPNQECCNKFPESSVLSALNESKMLRFDCVKGLTGQCNTHKEDS